jgi:hypothetical protein
MIQIGSVCTAVLQWGLAWHCLQQHTATDLWAVHFQFVGFSGRYSQQQQQIAKSGNFLEQLKNIFFSNLALKAGFLTKSFSHCLQ